MWNTSYKYSCSNLIFAVNIYFSRSMWNTAGRSEKTWRRRLLMSLMLIHSLDVRGCTRARTSDSDLDHWRRAMSGPRSMHHSLVTTDLQQSFYFNYSQCSRQHGGYNLCSTISKLYSSSVSAGECRRRRKKGDLQLTTVPTKPFGPIINFPSVYKPKALDVV